MTESSEGAKKIGAASLVLAVLIPFYFCIGKIYVDPSDPGFGAHDVPRLVVGIGLALSLVLLWQAWREREASKAKRWRKVLVGTGGPLTVAAVALGYVWAITAFQYALPTLLLLAGLNWFFGSRGLRDLVLIPCAAVALYYMLFFVILGIYEEPGTILSYDSYGLSRQIRQAIGLH